MKAPTPRIPSPRSANPALFIFDMGGVVSHDNHFERKLAASLGMPPQELFARTDLEFQELTAGRISLEEFWRKISRKTGRPVERDLFAEHFRPRLNRPVAVIVSGLRRATRVVVGTNTVEPHYRTHYARGHYGLFDAVYASFQMGLAKPDPEFFRFILRKEHRSAADSVFVDDREENVRAAAELGMRALLFTGARLLKREIEAIEGRRSL